MNDMRPEDTQRCVPDPDWETPEQQFDIALAKKQAEIDELVGMLLYCNPVPAKKTQYEALMDKHRGK